MDLIFFLLNPELVLSDALVIYLLLVYFVSAARCHCFELSFKASIWDFRLLITASRLLNFLASLESLFHLRFSCLLVRGASSNSGLSLSSIGSQV